MALFKREKIAYFCICQLPILKVFKEKKYFCVLGYLLFHQYFEVTLKIKYFLFANFCKIIAKQIIMKLISLITTGLILDLGYHSKIDISLKMFLVENYYEMTHVKQ